MKILVVGSGGREHALCWKLRQDNPEVELFCAPGNAGTAALGVNVEIAAEDVESLLGWAVENKPDMTVVGPEAPLCAGVVDAFSEAGLAVFGPQKEAARLEGSKLFAKEIMQAAHVPTAGFRCTDSLDEARAAVEEFGLPVVLKADGLAAGKGVMVCATQEEVEAALDALFVNREFGGASSQVLVEEFLSGEEVSLLAFVDGATVLPMVSAQDHKRLDNGDEGPNTGGMGAYSPALAVNAEMREVVMNRIFRPVVKELTVRGIDYKGVLYAGLMLTEDGPKVLEFNCRFGDPETQCILPRMKTPLLPVLEACVDGKLESMVVEWSEEACVCVVMAAGGYPGVYPKGLPIAGLEEAEGMPGVAVFHGGTARKSGAVVTAGGRVLGVTARGANISEAVRTAYHAVINIKFDNAHYRTDIAFRALETRA